MLYIRNSNGVVRLFLQSKRVMSLDIALLMAGAKERGELEARVTALINEIQKSGYTYFGFTKGFHVVTLLLKFLYFHCRKYYSFC